MDPLLHLGRVNPGALVDRLDGQARWLGCAAHLAVARLTFPAGHPSVPSVLGKPALSSAAPKSTTPKYEQGNALLVVLDVVDVKQGWEHLPDFSP